MLDRSPDVELVVEIVLHFGLVVVRPFVAHHAVLGPLQINLPSLRRQRILRLIFSIGGFFPFFVGKAIFELASVQGGWDDAGVALLELEGCTCDLLPVDEEVLRPRTRQLVLFLCVKLQEHLGFL